MEFLTSKTQRMGCGSHRTFVAIAVALFAFLGCIPSFGQVNLGRILGSVFDQSGGVIANASVTVTDVARGVSRSLVTDSAGEYDVPALIPGTYTVRAEAMGFKTIERQNIVVAVGHDVRVDLTLEPGAQNQTVTVTETAPLINLTNAQLEGSVEQVDLAELPIAGRQFYHVLNFQPGVLAIPGGDSIGYASNGGRVSNSMWLFDGVDETEMWSGTGPVAGQRQASIMPIDAVQGVDVIQNPGAEYGWRVGAIVNMGVKSGTNNVHGSAYFFDRNEIFDAKNPYLPSGSAKQTDSIRDFGMSIGGPIKKNKLFYFLSYEGEYFAVGNPYTQFEPTMLSGPGPALSFPDAIADLNAHSIPLSTLSLALAGCTAAATCDPTKGVFGAFPTNGVKAFAFNDAGFSHNGIGKVDYRPNDKHAFNVEYYAGKGDEYTPGSIQNYWAEGSPQLSEVGRAIWVWTPNSRWVNQARFGSDVNGGPVLPEECVRDLGQPNYASAFGYTPGTAGNPPSCAGKAFSPITIGNFDTLGNDSGGTSTYITHWSGMDTVSYTRGKHIFKFGGEIHFIHFYGFGKLNNLIGTLDFGNGAIPDAFSGASALEDFLAGEPDSGALLIGSSSIHVHQKRYAGFFQDDFRLLPRLTINYGLRYEYQGPVKSTENRLGNFDPTTPSGLVQESDGHPLYTTSKKGFGPRLGVVWDITGKGTTVLRAGGSLIDDNIINFNDLLHTVFGAALQVIPTGWDLTLANGSVVSPKPGNVDAGTVSLTGDAPGQPSLGQLTWQQNTPIFSTVGAALACGNNQGGNPPPCTLNAINPHLRQSYVSTWTMSFEHAFTNSLALSIAYVGNHGTALAGVVDVNQPALGTKGSTNELRRRPYYTQFPYFGQVRYYTPDLSSNYNGLQAYLNEHVWHGLNFTAGYTWSHALDSSTSDSSFNAFDNSNPSLNYGNSTIDIRHHFTFSGTYDIPGRKALGQLLQGWRISSTIDVMSGFPFNAVDNSDDLSGTGEKADRWNLVGSPSVFNAGGLTGLPCYGVTGSKFDNGACTTVASVSDLPQLCQTTAAGEPTNPNLPAGTKNATGIQALTSFGCYFSGSSAIVPPAQGTFGDMARNLLRAKPFKEWDATVTKDTKIGERFTVQLRLDIYNVTNSVEYQTPTASTNINPSNPGTFGVAPGTISSSGTVTRSGAPRNMFMGVKFLF